MNLIRRHIDVTGLVQGVGFRPFVWKAAQQAECTGWIRNSGHGIALELQGTPEAIASVVALLSHQPPPLARIHSVTQLDAQLDLTETEFRILESQATDKPMAFVSPDVATCNDCLRELADPANRRYRYPFINCTNCGPRFTIQQTVPYDRAGTTMSGFTMCDLCRTEYESPGDRRFHAQPNACANCGPTIWFVDQDTFTKKPAPALYGFDQHTMERDRLAVRPPSSASSIAESIQAARAAVAAGLIVAIKGIGGFHLACDARQPAVVARLRQRKHRPYKPLAVMVSEIATAANFVHLSDVETQMLCSPERPIVLLRKRQGSSLADELAPENPYLGVLLPYSPLHHLLLEEGDVWVMTSGNLADEPIAYDNADALTRLQSIADCFLLHDRPIHTVCDDSVLRSSSLGPIPIRRSRGFAPLPIPLLTSGSTVLAVGGELKSAICLMTGRHALMGQHIGDMGNPQTLSAIERSAENLQSLYQTKPELIVADAHPGYVATQFAKRWASVRGISCLQVQHHHAHAAALITEHGLEDDGAILACVMDGTGFGRDGAIWGGEWLIANTQSFERVAHLQYAPLPGGDQCILQPARTALAYLYQSQIAWSNDWSCVQFFKPSELKLLQAQLEKQINTVPTSSAGRFFDAVSSLIGLRHHIDYEGQAAMELEYLAETAEALGADRECYSIEWTSDYPSQLRLAPILRAVLADIAAGVERALIAYTFHRTIALAVTEQCQAIRQSRGEIALNKVGLTGGVFQNSLLLKLTHSLLTDRGFDVFIHTIVPPNDGGLALGQAAIARAIGRKK